MDKIVFNLDWDEYENDFLEETSAEVSGLWQQQACSHLAEKLNEMGLAARKYKQRFGCENHLDIKLSCYHHAIFISGERGAGKTVFLRNVKNIWERESKCAESKPNLYFIDTIDPTLLDIDDRFAEVIVASVYAAVEKKLGLADNQKCQGKDYKDKFFQILQKISHALGSASEFGELRGIDRIQKYRSGIHLERYFHQFLIASVNLLGCDALVLPIDDVDMKIDNAFGVLDDIRRLLSCPLILPIVSGDDDLYSHTVTMEFEGVLAAKKDASNFIQGQESAKKLSSAYLTKVFPTHDRIPLQPIHQLLPGLTIQYRKKSKEISYDDYQKRVMGFFYTFCRDVEYRKLSVVSNKGQWLQPQNARELVQLIRLFRPDEIEHSGIQNDKQKTLWQRFKRLAEIKRAGQALADAISFLYINEVESLENVSLHNLISFNPILQNKTYSWGGYDYYAIQNDARAKVNIKRTPHEEAQTVTSRSYEAHIDMLWEKPLVGCNKFCFFKYRKGDINILKVKFSLFPDKNSRETGKTESRQEQGKIVSVINRDSRINMLWEMPPVDFKKFYFEDNNEEGDKNINKLKLIYSFGESNGRREVVFGRAFEILFWSFLFVTESIECSDDGKGIFESIFRRYPFYSYLVFDADDIDVGEYNVLNESDCELVDDLSKWVQSNKARISGEVKGKNLIPLMSEVFFNVFSQIYRMKVEPDFDISDEYLPDIARRFEYIFMNSLLCCIKIEKIMHIDVAISDKSEKIRSRKDFLDSNESLKKNIEGILKLEPHNDKEHFIYQAGNPQSDIGTLLEVMWSHPIFQLPYGAGSCCQIKE
ncbi:ATP-binding protein [Dickeya dianthicola]|uniref:antiviral RADAR system adenosine triphosphatase RdrA n=2 Tax=Dickeya dianthicola TaxID=204039 RepID=UPI0004114D1D|nr:antiviral RADAR system adenosine triphosphatase RdrA [Dickeya dianthicola]MCI4030967.1 ATP-binding protein [Dickeya dianthicola]MCI4172207.1 ATP-binding protein [Dickeya dianthicola]MCI4177729.1 ATP-binding protein [Dickeya dianthicola]MCI4181828.1 ATP-binding protein [Dickeya dianthicola]MCI4195785.1 ATP-binding protein [Dickeya dianthicola]